MPSAPLPCGLSRSWKVDALRGTAVVWMTAFHFCFDLNHHGFIRQNFLADPFWAWQRTAIVSLFVFCAGLGQALALEAGQGWPRFWRRWMQVAGCALLVTAGSWWMFPHSFIYFGVLHGVAAMLVAARLTGGAGGGWLWPLGGLAILSPWVAQALLPGTPLEAPFDAVPLQVLGWVTHRPVTEDYVPIFPWLGVLWWGMAAGRTLQRRGAGRIDRATQPPAAAVPLAWLGRHSLPWYMLHQPALLGAVSAAAWLLR